MKKKSIIIVVIIFLFILAVAYMLTRAATPNDQCSSVDKQSGNCIPAGMCHPDPSVNATMDCDVKNYDKKLNSSI